MISTMLQVLEERVQQGDPSAVAVIEQTVGNHQATEGDHTRWGRLCEQVGLIGLAFHEFQLAVRDNRHDAVALRRLAEHYRERGDTDRAAAILERLLDVEPTSNDYLETYVDLMRAEGALPRLRETLDTAIARGLPRDRVEHLLHVPEPGEAGVSQVPAEPTEAKTDRAAAMAPTDSDCVRFATLFAGREDVYARQWCRPGDRQIGYAPVHEPLTPAVVRNHLLGTYTIGVYPLRLDQTANWFAIDLDITRPALDHARHDPDVARGLRDLTRRTGIALLTRLRALRLDPLFENSGYKGRHYWVFLEQPESGKVLHQLGRLMLAELQRDLPSEFSLEFFPKQARRSGKGLGNLIKLPLGVHRRTGYRSQLLDEHGSPVSDPFTCLRQAARAERKTLYELIQQLKASRGPMTAESEETGESTGEEAEVSKATTPLLPPDVPPPWTEADFEADPRIRHMLEECPVLGELKRQVDEHRQLSHDEQVVLVHTLGHVPGGPQAVNYLLDQCVDVGTDAFMKSQLKGNPISCPRIRTRIGHVTRRVRCRCAFEFASDHYPTPVLHLHTLPKDALPQPADCTNTQTDLETLARRYTVLEQRRYEIDKQWTEMRDALCQAIRALPERCLAVEGGVFRLTEQEGVETLQWEVPTDTDTPLEKTSSSG